MKVSTRRLIIQATLERSVDALIIRLGKDITVAMVERVQKQMTQQQQDRLYAELSVLIAAFFVAFAGLLVLAAGKIALMRAKEAIEEISPRLERVGLVSDAIALSEVASGYKEAVEGRILKNTWPADGKTLQSRISGLKTGTTAQVRQIIRDGVKRGDDVGAMAQAITQYLRPEAQSRAKVFTSTGGSLSYNAVRIARTESAQVYRQAMIDLYKNRSYVKAWGWYLSNNHPKTDECDAYSKVEYKSYADYPTAHPNCLCDQRPIFYTDEELRRKAK